VVKVPRFRFFSPIISDGFRPECGRIEASSQTIDSKPTLWGLRFR